VLVPLSAPEVRRLLQGLVWDRFKPAEWVLA
jgi:hypothetical protein